MATQLLEMMRQTEHNTSVKHRLAIRYHPGPNTTCVLFTCIGKQGVPASINDISLSGISISVDLEVVDGSYVVLELRNSERDFCRLLQLKVVRVSYDHGGGVVACGIFTKQLSDNELQLLR